MAATYRIEQPDGSVYQIEMSDEGKVRAPASPQPDFGTPEIIRQTPGLSLRDILPHQLGNLVGTATQPSITNVATFLPRTLLAGTMDAGRVLSAPVNLAQTAITRVSQRRPQLPFSQAIRSSLSGAEVPLEQGQPSRMDQFINLAAQVGVGSIPFGSVATRAGNRVAQALETTPYSDYPVFGKAFRMFKKTPPGKILNDAEFEQLAGNVRQAFGGGKLSAGINFDQGITKAVDADPNVVTPLNDWLDTLKADAKADPALAEKLQQGMLRSAKQGNTTLQAMLADESRASSANGRDLQNIKQTIQSVPSIDRALQRTYALQRNPRLGRFDATVSDADLVLIDHLGDLRGRILSAYPELQQDYATYSQFMADYRTLAPQFRTASIEKTLLEKYGNALQRQAAKRVLPSEILQKVEQVRTQQQQTLAKMEQTKEFHKVLRRLGYLGIGGAVAAGLASQSVRPVVKAIFNQGK